MKRELAKPLADGVLTGLFLQMAVGPVFFYILGITMESNYLNSLSAVTAVTLADYIFIFLSLMGIGRLLQEERIKTIFGVGSAAVLILFGLVFLQKGIRSFDAAIPLAAGGWTPAKSFLSCFVLTLSSPLTIVFWGSVFSAKAFEKNYMKAHLAVFGIGAGAATFVFLSLAMLGLSFFRAGIPQAAVQILNGLVGILLVYYGIKGGIKVLKTAEK
ncbi:MAG: LysE family transporter [Desulfobacter sp.]|nr:MAG: LysE family transporter [Desulfobacter sp.]